jgi:hypothetical protein
VFSIGGSVVGEFSGAAASTTDNRMELTAALEAIGRAPARVALEILTDSKNVIGWLAQVGSVASRPSPSSPERLTLRWLKGLRQGAVR